MDVEVGLCIGVRPRRDMVSGGMGLLVLSLGMARAGVVVIVLKGFEGSLEESSAGGRRVVDCRSC
jgi:hypothetical protein